ncbi:MAG: hypothetical protein MZV64_17420 [Ignavibacteriales bacterium]|nr:hypothetical protein [Ignavibacteriales bacterium]
MPRHTVGNSAGFRLRDLHQHRMDAQWTQSIGHAQGIDRIDQVGWSERGRRWCGSLLFGGGRGS